MALAFPTVVAMVRSMTVQPLTRRRFVAAIVVAVIADILQLASGPLGWFWFDQIVDALAMIITIRLIGFHWLLLPTFALEFIPFTDMLPTWTGCVLLVIRQRKNQQIPVAPTKVEVAPPRI